MPLDLDTALAVAESLSRRAGILLREADPRLACHGFVSRGGCDRFSQRPLDQSRQQHRATGAVHPACPGCSAAWLGGARFMLYGSRTSRRLLGAAHLLVGCTGRLVLCA